MTPSVRIEVASETSAVGAARRAGASLAESARLGEEAAAKLALVVTELGTNLVKHTHGGMLLLRILSPLEGGEGVEILSLDRGPGMKNVAQCLRDGYSTGGSLGNGLGAVMRASTTFDIHSDPKHGTAILSRVATKPEEIALGAVCVPKKGQTLCGDGWAVAKSGDAITLVVVDGLGHGPLAADAARAALKSFQPGASSTPADVIAKAHEAARATRGAVIGVARIEARHLAYAGVGNIAATIIDDEARRGLASQNGTIGGQLPALRTFEDRLREKALLVLHSDGISTRWSTDDHAGVVAKHPAVLAGILYRDFSRGHDDTAVVVVRP